MVIYSDKYYLYLWDSENKEFIEQSVLCNDDGTFTYGSKDYKHWKNMFNVAIKRCLNRKPLVSDLFYCIWTNEKLTSKQLDFAKDSQSFKF